MKNHSSIRRHKRRGDNDGMARWMCDPRLVLGQDEKGDGVTKGSYQPRCLRRDLMRRSHEASLQKPAAQGTSSG